MINRTINRLALTTAVATAGALACAAGSPVVAYAAAGITAFDQQITADPAGDVFTQAGGHPYAITTEIELNHHLGSAIFGTEPQVPDADAKDIITKLPPGLFGNPNGIAQCTIDQLVGSKGKLGLLSHHPECPIGSQVGTIEVRTPLVELFTGGAYHGFVEPLFNMVPPFDQPASFGFEVQGVPVVLSGNVRNGSDFGITVISANIPTALPISGITLTFWGVPADPRHDIQRCDSVLSAETHECPGASFENELAGPNADPEDPKAFLTMPVLCTKPGEALLTNLQVDFWAEPGVFHEANLLNHELPGYPAPESEWGAPAGINGCGFVPFKPSVSVQPSNHQADTPTGLLVEFSLPQEGLLAPEGIETSDVQKTVFSLPAGMSVSPAAADGLGACSLAQIGLGNGEPPSCPNSSKMGTVEIDTPLMATPLDGAIYLAKQEENPFHGLIALYLVAEGHGVMLKLAGEVNLDPVSGQLVATFDKSPQLPFSHLKINFKGGPRSPIVNPHECGTYTASAQLTPWSGAAPAQVASSFDITSGPGGAPCPNPHEFAPGFTIGTTSNQAGGFSPMSLTMTRADGDEQLARVAMKTPSGLLGMLSSVALCPEPQASQGNCPEDSQIGTVTAGAGAGANPIFVRGGKVFITGPYEGAPFGLSVVVPAVAGPFNLGTVVVRGTISVDPVTTSLTITTDPLPTILKGIPLDLRLVNVSIDRPGFVFNPTNCEPQAITGTLTGGLGDVEPVVSHFQVTNCAILGFEPKFTVSTSAHTSRTEGASLDAKLSYPSGSFGKEANIAKVRVELPAQLPSRLTTLQKACPDTVFEANPANCPAGSKVGTATANTPILPVQMTGTAYFVSHGGAKFPELTIVLTGYGTTVELHGETFISKAGVTSTTFNTVPDVPMTSFELKLPEGPGSALAANGDLCASKLAMPTTFTAQNGKVIEKSTPIAVEGCAPEITVVSHKVSGKRATVVVHVPSAGTLIAGGSGLSRVVRAVHGAGDVAVTLKLTKKDQRFVARHHGRRLMAPIRLAFKPSRGKKLTASIAVLMR